jgi:hypothetical protein
MVEPRRWYENGRVFGTGRSSPIPGRISSADEISRGSRLVVLGAASQVQPLVSRFAVGGLPQAGQVDLVRGVSVVSSESYPKRLHDDAIAASSFIDVNFSKRHWQRISRKT